MNKKETIIIIFIKQMEKYPKKNSEKIKKAAALIAESFMNALESDLYPS
jgi:uncharacterized phosphosugar-binding protein